jgi:hypothetical protein
VIVFIRDGIFITIVKMSSDSPIKVPNINQIALMLLTFATTATEAAAIIWNDFE